MSVTTWKVLDDRFLITEDKNSAVNHKIPGPVIIKQEPEPQQRADTTEDPESQPIKEEHVEQLIVQDEGRLLVKQETNSFMVSPAYQEVFHNGPELQQMMETKEEPELVRIKEEHEDLCGNQDRELLVINQDADIFIRAPVCEQQDSHDLDPNIDQLLSSHCPDAENQHQQGRRQKDLGSCGDEGLEPERRHQDCINHRDNVENSKVKKSKANLPCCEVCGKCFAKRKYVTVHMRTHTGEKPYSCTFCGKAFIDHSTRARHTRTHTGVKPYPCELCDKSFTQPNHLAHHLRTHTGEKPFSCLTCGKDFTQQSNLTVHMRTHTGEKPYYCELCDKSFIQPSGLTRHLRTHTGEKPFSCLTCGKGFIQQSNLTVHMRTHTGKKPRFTD